MIWFTSPNFEAVPNRVDDEYDGDKAYRNRRNIEIVLHCESVAIVIADPTSDPVPWST